MTSNQINYWQNVERERANRANEALTSRGHDIEERRVGQKDVELAMSNLMNYLEHGQRGDLGYMYGINAGGQTGSSKPSEFDRIAYGTPTTWADTFGGILNGLFPFDINLKL